MQKYTRSNPLLPGNMENWIRPAVSQEIQKENSHCQKCANLWLNAEKENIAESSGKYSIEKELTLLKRRINTVEYTYTYTIYSILHIETSCIARSSGKNI